MWFPQAAIGPALPALATMLSARAAAYAAQHRRVLDATLPPFVALSFADRTRLLLELLDPTAQDYLIWWALAAMPFLAFHTAGHLNTAYAVRHRHPGLGWIGFPQPDRDGLEGAALVIRGGRDDRQDLRGICCGKRLGWGC